MVHSESFPTYGGVPRHALHAAPEGRLFALMSRAVLEIMPGGVEHRKLADTPVGISCGGALVDGVLYFGSGTRLWSFDVAGGAAGK